MSDLNTIGYHGTTRAQALRMVNERFFPNSDRKNEWLGKGIYFFAYKEHASWWISHSRYVGQETAIVVADLRYTKEQLLDLDDPAQLQILDDIVREAVEFSDRSKDSTGAEIKTKQQNWCFACNLIKQLCPEIGIIMYTFRDSGKRSYYTYSRLTGNQKQICVSEHSIITNVKIV